MADPDLDVTIYLAEQHLAEMDRIKTDAAAIAVDEDRLRNLSISRQMLEGVLAR